MYTFLILHQKGGYFMWAPYCNIYSSDIETSPEYDYKFDNLEANFNSCSLNYIDNLYETPLSPKDTLKALNSQDNLPK